MLSKSFLGSCIYIGMNSEHSLVFSFLIRDKKKDKVLFELEMKLVLGLVRLNMKF